MTRTHLISVAAALMAIGAAAPAQAAPKPAFKADVTVQQDTDWSHTWRWPLDDECGSDHVYYTYKGEGFGELSAKGNGKRVTFSGKSVLESTEIRLRGFARSDASWQIQRMGTPSADCKPSEAKPVDTSGCNPLVRKPGTARIFLLVVRGRLQVTGGFYRDDKGTPCGDPSLYTGAIGYAGPASRRDVDDLIRSKRVRSIELTAKKTTKFGLDDLREPGANTRLLAASGTGKASWRVKLTRLPR
jgi:hypothetical protein